MDKSELRRLEKAARDKNKQKLLDWGNQFERYLSDYYRRYYEQIFHKELADAVANYNIAIAYSLHFSEVTQLETPQLKEFLQDLYATVDLYRSGEYKPEEYKEILDKVNIQYQNHDYSAIYKKYIKNTDGDLVQYLCGDAKRPVSVILGNPEFRNTILNKKVELAMQGNMTFIDDLEILNSYFQTSETDKMDNIEVIKDMILICENVYIIDVDNKINENIQQYIKYAQDHNKKIIYYSAL